MFLSIFLAQATNPAINETDLTAGTSESVSTAITETAKATQASLWDHIMGSDPILQFTLLVLIIFSIISWAIIIYKIIQLSQAQKSAVSFWQVFSTSPTIGDVIATNKASRSGPLYEIFVAGQQVLAKVKKASSSFTDFHRNVILQKMNQSREEEMYKLEQYVSFLATAASSAPFIGLFGTVYGILLAFNKLSTGGSSSLAVVGPHIAEALVATAVGLFAAIPAVIAYNFFVGKVRLVGKMMDLFTNDFILKSEREPSA